MNSDTTELHVLLVEDDADYAGLVQQWLHDAPAGQRFSLSWTDSVATAINRLAQGDIKVVLLDLNLPDSDGIGTFQALHDIAGGVPIIILSSASSESLALQAIRYGAEDYLVKSACSADLLSRALGYAAVRRRRDAGEAEQASPGSPNRLVTVIGAKGGVGTTTVACTLAAELHAQSKQPVLLADLDGNSGLAAFAMGVEGRYSICDAIRNLDRLDKTIWQAMVTPAAGVDLLCSPAPDSGADPDPASVARVIGFARRLYEWVVLDLGRLAPSRMTVFNAARNAGDVLLVTTDSLWALHEARRTIDALCKSGLERERLGVIVNQAEETSEALPNRELVQLFGAPVYARLPHNPGELRAALLEKRLPAESGGFRRSLRNVARRLAGLEELKPRRTIPGFGSFLNRVKRTSESRVQTLTQ
jgi:pilus assembly protein CpaE